MVESQLFTWLRWMDYLTVCSFCLILKPMFPLWLFITEHQWIWLVSSSALYPLSKMTRTLSLFCSWDDNDNDNDSLGLNHCFRSRKHAFALCRMWWESEMLSGNNTTKIYSFVSVFWSCENLFFLRLDSPCKRCNKDDIELQRVNDSHHKLLYHVVKTSFGEISDLVRKLFVGGYL